MHLGEVDPEAGPVAAERVAVGPGGGRARPARPAPAAWGTRSKAESRTASPRPGASARMPSVTGRRNFVRPSRSPP